MPRMTQTLMKGDRPSAPEPYLASTAKGRRERRVVLTEGTAAAAERDDGGLAWWLIAVPRYTAVAAVRIYRDPVGGGTRTTWVPDARWIGRKEAGHEAGIHGEGEIRHHDPTLALPLPFELIHPFPRPHHIRGAHGVWAGYHPGRGCKSTGYIVSSRCISMPLQFT